MKIRLLRLWNAILCAASPTFREHAVLVAQLRQAQDALAGCIRERDSMALSVQHATAKAAELQIRHDIAVEREAAALRESNAAMKQVVNYSVLCSGSKIVPFPEVGPEMPERPASTTPPEPIRGPMRARQRVMLNNDEFVKDYLREQEASSASAS